MNVSAGSTSVAGLFEPKQEGKKVIFCTPTITKPYQGYMDSLEASIPLIVAAGWQEGAVWEVGNPYISIARSIMLRKALDAGADTVVFIDHDLSWDAHDLLTLLQTEGDVVCGTYRFKREPVEYMGQLVPGPDGCPIVREDGAIRGWFMPAGFLKVTRKAVNQYMAAYPELVYGEPSHPHVDLFNHGAHKGVWYGEDFAFCRRWVDAGHQIWVVPDLNITHHTKEQAYPGNFHQFLLSRPQ